MSQVSIGGVVGIIMVLLLVLVAVKVFFVLVNTVKQGMAGGSGGRNSDDETRLMQDLHDGIERLMQRVEALETILMDDDGRVRTARTAGQHEEEK